MKKVKALFVSALLLVGLAACGNNENGEKAADKSAVAGTEKKRNSEAMETNDRSNTYLSEEDRGEMPDLEDGKIGLTMDDFKDRFNELAGKNNLGFQVGEYEWFDRAKGVSTAEVKFNDNYVINGMVITGEEELKALLLEAGGDTFSRETVLGLIRTMIGTTNPSLSNGDIDGLLEDLKLIPDENEEETFAETEKDGLKYMVNEEGNNDSIEFIIVNESDPDFEQ